MLTSLEIRQQFLDYFVRKQKHSFVPSSPVVPHDDPTLMFANAGMNQFKDVFLATGERDYKRAVNTQKCIRAGGKHNDLEDVGKDTYHHTFFEMLGNWSFGDYFKKQAITWAWELLTEVWKLDKSRLHVTVFGGDSADGLEPDGEAAELWRKVTDIHHDHIHFFGKKDNFWEMGDTGPCGPCSEIHIDLTPDKTGKKLVNADDPRVMEIWNLVFIQYNRATSGKLSPLPAKHVDTGMGFERVTAVLQNKSSNYDTDIFAPLFEAIRVVTGAKPYGGKLDDSPAGKVDMAYRVIADHIRCLTFALTDGALPSNEGRGYVLRRILRRAVRHGYQTLGMHEPFLYKLSGTVVETMGEAFPELKKNPKQVEAVIRDEEESFGRTLERGIRHFDECIAQAVGQEATLYILEKYEEFEGGIESGVDDDPRYTYDVRYAESANDIVNQELPHEITVHRDGEDLWLVDSKGKRVEQIGHVVQISADDAFKLHDTYGFPLDLTQVMAEERGMTVDVEGFHKLMDEARERARAVGGKGDDTAALVEIVQRDKPPATEFLGYDATQAAVATTCRVYRKVEDGYESTDRADAGQHVAMVVGKTPFYAEAGGQVSDTGMIVTPTGTVHVTGMARVGEAVFHLGIVEQGHLESDGDTEIELKVDEPRRAAIMANHTGTHVLNHKLRAVLGDHVQQKGSLVDDEKLRFDFSHSGAMTPEQLEEVETLANADITADLPVYTQHVPQEEALKVHGLRAVFGEKYPPLVRVVSIGAPVEDLLAKPSEEKWYRYSIEFCGGTHLEKTGDAEGLVIASEEAVAKGVRRITALTGSKAHQAAAEAEMLQSRLDALGGAPVDRLREELPALVTNVNEGALPAGARAKLRESLSALQKQLKEYEKQQSKAASGSAVDAARAIAETAQGQVIVAAIEGADAKTLRDAMDVIRKKRPDAALLLGAVTGDKCAFLASVPKEMIGQGLKAGDWVREVAQTAGGGGGGRPDMAQAGGKDPAKFEEALEVGRQWGESKVQGPKAKV